MRRGRGRLSRRQFGSDPEARREVLGVFWRQREDFDTLRAYNDHLESVEDTIAALIDGDKDAVAAAWDALDAYRSAHPATRDHGVRAHQGQSSSVTRGSSSPPQFATSVVARVALPPAPELAGEARTAEEWLEWSRVTEPARLRDPALTSAAEEAAGGFRRVHAYEYASQLAYAAL
eukprot:Rhum_TRINITY_DN8021_c0_g2::Rhum_TRINITY_DN8021_c0_g2_i1::g.25803::m.25803